ncbi:hypothetical protein BD769DRAFT_1398275, partial [Suillus cothurnatus]
MALSLEFMQDLWVRQIFCTTGHMLLVYDYLLTLEDEVCYIWNRPWTVVKVMFLINRYGNLIVQTFIRLEEAGLLSHNSQVFCQCFELFTSCCMGLSAESIHIIVLMRTWAIWGTHKRVASIIMWSYISYILVLMGTAMYGATTSHFQFMHLDMTNICIGTAPRNFSLSTLLISSIYSVETQSYFSLFAIPLLSVAGQRLVLNLRGSERRTYATQDLSREVDRQLEAFAAADCPCRDDMDHLEKVMVRNGLEYFPYYSFLATFFAFPLCCVAAGNTEFLSRNKLLLSWDELMGMGRGREYGLRREADWGSWDIDMGLHASEEGDVRKGDGCGWPKDRYWGWASVMARPSSGNTLESVYGPTVGKWMSFSLGEYLQKKYGQKFFEASASSTNQNSSTVHPGILSNHTWDNENTNSALHISQTEMDQTSETGSQDFIPPDPALPTQLIPPTPTLPIPMIPVPSLSQTPMPTPLLPTPSQSSLPILPTNLMSMNGTEAVSDFNTLQWDYDDVEFNSEPPTPGLRMQPDVDGLGEGNRAEPNPLESVAIPAPQVDCEDPLCRLINVQELDALHLMTKFQPELKLFVCEWCQCGVWADQLVGHITNNHKQRLSHNIKKTTLETTIQAASQRLGAAEYSQCPIVLPKRALPPLPWLLEPVRGYQCRHCAYVAGTFDSLLDHGKKTHSCCDLGPCIFKQDQPVFAQRLFSKNQYFVVHVMLQNVGPNHLFAKFYSTLSTWYINGAFVTATEGYSLATLRDLSVYKQDIDCLARIRGIGTKYLSTISSASEIDHALLDALTSWRTRYRPFQMLQEKRSVEAYGVHCDRLIMMILRIKFLHTTSDDGTCSEVGSDYGEQEDDKSVEEDVISPGLDWDDMDFTDGDADDDERERGRPDEDESEILTSLDTIDDLAPYPVFLNTIQKQRAEVLRESCADRDSSEEQLMKAYHLLLLSVFTTHTNDNSQPLHSLIDSFIMSTSINVQGQFVSPHLISSHLSKIVYAALFSILTEVMMSPDPYQTFMKTMKVWIEPVLPRLQFTTSGGPDFTFDGKSLSVTSITQMYHSVYRDMVRILEENLLFGASDADLQPLKAPEEIMDKLHERVLGHGVLVSEMQVAWNLMKFIMSDEKLLKKYFTIDSSGYPVPQRGTWEQYLEDIEAFKERFQASVASIGAWAIDLVLPAESIDPHHHCYLLSSKGQRWTSERLSRILQRLTSKYLPGKVSHNMSSLRHILPGIAEHYRISDVLTLRTDDVLHSQLGHSQNTGDRMYARAHDDHPRLTSTMVHRTMQFCDLWQELLGFKEDIPNEDDALSLQALYAHQQSSSKNTLSLLWTSSPIAASNPDLMLLCNRDLLEEIQNLWAALAQLTGMVSSISKVVLPSATTAPAVQLSRPSNSGIHRLIVASAGGLGRSCNLVDDPIATLNTDRPPADYEASRNQQLDKRRSLASNSEDQVEERPSKRLRTAALVDDQGHLGVDSLSPHTTGRPSSADSE